MLSIQHTQYLLNILDTSQSTQIQKVRIIVSLSRWQKRSPGSLCEIQYIIQIELARGTGRAGSVYTWTN